MFYLYLLLTLVAVSQPEISFDDAEIVFTIPEKTLFPEGIAFDPKSGDFFLGSVYESRILRVHPDGSYEEFVTSREYDLRGTLGMEVDPERRVLWVNTATRPRQKELEPDISDETGVFKFNVDTGELLAKSLIPMEHNFHVFNDMAIDNNGNVYITSTFGGAVYRVDGSTAKIELFVRMEGMVNNGIAIDRDRSRLYVAANDDLFLVDIASKSFQKMSSPEGVTLGHCDGLYMYEGSLIGIRYTSIGDDWSVCICKYSLDDAKENVLSVEELICDDSRFSMPTTGVPRDSGFYFIATSHLDKLGRDGVLDQEASLSDVLIMRLPLGK